MRRALDDVRLDVLDEDQDDDEDQGEEGNDDDNTLLTGTDASSISDLEGHVEDGNEEPQGSDNDASSAMLRALLEEDRASPARQERIPNLRRSLAPLREPADAPAKDASEAAWNDEAAIPMTEEIGLQLYFAPEDQGQFRAKRRGSVIQNEQAAATLRAVAGAENVDQHLDDSLPVRPCCGMRQKWRFRNIVLLMVLTLQAVTIIVLVIPAASLMKQSTTQLDEGCSLSSARQLNLTTRVLLDLSGSLGMVAGSALFEHLVDKALEEPILATKSIADAYAYAHGALRASGAALEFHIGTYDLSSPVPQDYLNLTLWSSSAGPLLTTDVRSGLYAQVAKTFVLRDDQYADVQVSRVNGTVSRALTTLMDLSDPTAAVVGAQYELDLATWLPGDLAFTVELDDGPNASSSQWWDALRLVDAEGAQDGEGAATNASIGAEWRLFQAVREVNAHGQDAGLQGKWSELDSFVGVFGSAPHQLPGYIFAWPWAPCGDPTCIEGVFGAAITLRDLSTYSNTLVNEILVSLSPVRKWVQDGTLVSVLDASGFTQLEVDPAAASSAELAPLTVKEFTALIDHAVAFMVVAGSGRLAAVSRDVVDWGLGMAEDASNPTVREISRMLRAKYGAFDAANANYSDVIADAVHQDTMEPCLVDDALLRPDDILQCLLVTASVIRVDPVQGFPTNNSLVFVQVAVVPYVAVLGNLTSTVRAVQAVMQEFTTSSDRFMQHSNIIEAIMAGALMVISAVLAFALATTVSEPLQRLRSSVRRLRDLDLRQTERFHSRVKEVNSVQETFSALRNTLRVVEKYIPRPVVRQIFLNADNARELNVTSRVVTIMFSDLRGFTSIAEVLRPNELLGFLTHYLTVMSRVIEAFEGTIGEIQGDGILAFWNTPDLVDDHAAKACSSALAQQEALREINGLLAAFLESYGLEPLGLRIGIHTGRVLTGNIGSLAKRKFGCVGDAINLASRLEGVCKLYGASIICSAETFELLPRATFACRRLDLVTVKGKASETVLYEVLAQAKAYRRTRCARVINPSILSAAATKSASLFASISSSLGSRPTSRHSSRSASRGGRVAGIRNLSQVPGPRLWRRRSHAKALVRTDFLPSRQLADNRLADVRVYEDALGDYQKGRFAEAKACLAQLSCADKASEHLLERVETALQAYHARADCHELPGDWTGVLHLDEKSFS